jgi:hypothetical protein
MCHPSPIQRQGFASRCWEINNGGLRTVRSEITAKQAFGFDKYLHTAITAVRYRDGFTSLCSVHTGNVTDAEQGVKLQFRN